MASLAAPTVHPEGIAAQEPLLEAGDRLTRDEFERRYQRMPHVQKAELIEGTVYMPSPVRVERHAKPHNHLGTWLGVYASETPAVECCDNSTVRLDLDNEPQPDLVLFKSASKGGQVRVSSDDYIEGAPELAVEIVGTSQAYDLHQKKGAVCVSTLPGSPARNASFGGNCAKENTTSCPPIKTACSKAAFSPASGSTPKRCCGAT